MVGLAKASGGRGREEVPKAEPKPFVYGRRFVHGISCDQIRLRG